MNFYMSLMGRWPTAFSMIKRLLPPSSFTLFPPPALFSRSLLHVITPVRSLFSVTTARYDETMIVTYDSSFRRYQPGIPLPALLMSPAEETLRRRQHVLSISLTNFTRAAHGETLAQSTANRSMALGLRGEADVEPHHSLPLLAQGAVRISLRCIRRATALPGRGLSH